MAQTAAETDTAVRAAMEKYRSQILSDRTIDPDTGIYLYEGRITEAAILKLAKVRSRSTLLGAHHKQLRADLGELVDDLKAKTGKKAKLDVDQIGASGEEHRPSASLSSRLDRYVQTIAAQHFEILRLEKENAELRAGQIPKVTRLHRRKPQV